MHVSKILGIDGKWKIDESGKIIVKEIETETIRSEKGYTVPDEDTRVAYCIKVKSGAIVAAPGACGNAPIVPSSPPSPEPTLVEPNATTTATSTNP